MTPVAGNGGAGRSRDWAEVGADRRPLTLVTNCTVIAGRPARAVISALRTATVGTLWRSAGRNWRITASPLLPGQSGSC